MEKPPSIFLQFPRGKKTVMNLKNRPSQTNSDFIRRMKAMKASISDKGIKVRGGREDKFERFNSGGAGKREKANAGQGE